MTKFTDEQLLERACLRVAMVIRGMWEEKGSSDTRLLCPPLIPDNLVIVGRSLAYKGRGRREHVVPRLVIIKECHAMLERGATDTMIADLIRSHTRIVLVTEEESRTLDQVQQLGLRQQMPTGWQFGGDLFSRLALAKIAWEPVGSQGLDASEDLLEAYADLSPA